MTALRAAVGRLAWRLDVADLRLDEHDAMHEVHATRITAAFGGIRYANRAAGLPEPDSDEPDSDDTAPMKLGRLRVVRGSRAG